MRGSCCILSIESGCQAIMRLREDLKNLSDFLELTTKGKERLGKQLAAQYCPYSACPVPSGLIKVVKVEARAVLPSNITIKMLEPKP
jgi:hypothetical protein